tara:strand:+ start:1717 stop:2865 length:1149 start_codon:yes stop_codon:yes gene_type:complete
MLAGIKFGEIFYNSLKNNRFPRPFSFIGGKNYIFTALIIAFILSIIVHYVVVYVFGSGRGGGSPLYLAILSRILNRSFIFLILSTYVIFNWSRINRNKKYIFYSSVTIYILSLIFVAASKGALFWTGFWLFICLLAGQSKDSNIRISKPILISLIPILLISISLYDFGNQIRYVLAGSLKGTEVSFTELWENKDKLKQFSFGGDLFKESLPVSISRRLSQIDYLIIMFNQEPIHKEYFTLSYTLKNIANQILPGMPYPNVVHVARLFRVSYGHKTMSEVFDQYHTDMIPYFGNVYLMFGYILFLPIIFFTGVIFSSIYCFYSSNKNLYFQRTICLYLFYTLIFQMGIDSFFGELIFFVIFPIIGINVLKLLFIPKFPRLRTI